MDQDASQPDADGWYRVPHSVVPIDYGDLDPPSNGEDPAAYYERFWVPEVRTPQRIQELEFINALNDDMDGDGGIEDYDFRSVWHTMKNENYSTHQEQFKKLYEAVRSHSNPSLGNARMFELMLPERRSRGQSQSFIQLWLDCSKPLLDSVFFNTQYRPTGSQCLIIRRVTHVRFCYANGMLDPSEYPRDAMNNFAVQGGNFNADGLNYPSYVVQRGSLKNVLSYRLNSLTTVFLNEAGNEFDNIEDPKGINDPRTVVKTPFTYFGADENKTIRIVSRFTLDNEQSLLPQAPEAVLKAIQMGKRWSKAFTHRYYRPGGRGARKEKEAFANEGLAEPAASSEPGPSSAGEEPVPKRGRSHPSELLAMWPRGRGPKAPRGPE